MNPSRSFLVLLALLLSATLGLTVLLRRRVLLIVLLDDRLTRLILVILAV